MQYFNLTFLKLGSFKHKPVIQEFIIYQRWNQVYQIIRYNLDLYVESISIEEILIIELCILNQQVASNKKLMEEVLLTSQNKINANKLKKEIFSGREKLKLKKRTH